MICRYSEKSLNVKGIEIGRGSVRGRGERTGNGWGAQDAGCNIFLPTNIQFATKKNKTNIHVATPSFQQIFLPLEAHCRDGIPERAQDYGLLGV